MQESATASTKPVSAWRSWLTKARYPSGEMAGLVKTEPGLSRRGERELYRRPASFVDVLNFQEYDPVARVFRFNDGRTVAALFELRPVDAAGRPPEVLIEIRDRIVQALAVIPEHNPYPWVLQLFVQDEPLTALTLRIRHYARELGARSVSLDAFLEEMDAHFAVLARPGRHVHRSPDRGALGWPLPSGTPAALSAEVASPPGRAER